MACTIAVARRGQQCRRVRIFQALRGGYRSLADGADAGVGAVDRLLIAGQAWAVAMPLERGADGAVGTLVAAVGEGLDAGSGEGVGQACCASGGQIVGRVGQRG
ncbi:hypothetical protein GCM10022248_44370 [Nonomuraea soli]